MRAICIALRVVLSLLCTYRMSKRVHVSVCIVCVLTRNCVCVCAGMQARAEEYKQRHPGSSWPETEYVLGDEESLPLEPSSVDGE